MTAGFRPQVKLAHQESELMAQLKRLPLGPPEVGVVRDKARMLSQGRLRREEAVLPVMLGTFVFEVLANDSRHRRSKEDEELGFTAALSVLGKSSFETGDQPFLPAVRDWD